MTATLLGDTPWQSKIHSYSIVTLQLLQKEVPIIAAKVCQTVHVTNTCVMNTENTHTLYVLTYSLHH